MFFFGSDPLIIRRISNSKNEVFLTFDDGPDPIGTPLVLDLLLEVNAKASFFVIGKKAQEHPEIIARILREGHSVFSHSFDHGYRRYFGGKEGLRDWISESLLHLTKLTSDSQLAFRPPAGVLTPPLLSAARELHTPLILWNHRFYDTCLEWKLSKALNNAWQLHSGDIILLHDSQNSKWQNYFLNTLKKYLQAILDRGYLLSKLKRETIENEVNYSEMNEVKYRKI